MNTKTTTSMRTPPTLSPPTNQKGPSLVHRATTTTAIPRSHLFRFLLIPLILLPLHPFSACYFSHPLMFLLLDSAFSFSSSPPLPLSSSHWSIPLQTSNSHSNREDEVKLTYTDIHVSVCVCVCVCVCVIQVLLCTHVLVLLSTLIFTCSFFNSHRLYVYVYVSMYACVSVFICLHF